MGHLLYPLEPPSAVRDLTNSTAGIIGYVQIYPRGHGTVGKEERWRSRPFVRVWRERNVMFVEGKESNATLMDLSVWVFVVKTATGWILKYANPSILVEIDSFLTF